MRGFWAIAVVVLLALVCLMAFAAVRARAGAGGARGGAEAPGSVLPGGENVVVDALNLAHWLRRRRKGAPGAPRVGVCDVLAAVETTAPLLRRLYPGRVVYVTKTREARAGAGATARLRALYQAAARRCGVHIHVVERLPDEAGAPDAVAAAARRGHSALGRDDFYLLMLARDYRAPVLSHDRFRDLPDMKAGGLAPFHVFGYSPVRTVPARDFVNPAAAEFRRLRRPVLVDFPSVLPHL